MSHTLETIAIYGGSFDPVHQAHLNTAKCIQDQFKFDRFYFVPCKFSLLKKQSSIETQHRLNMLELALKNYPEFQIDYREVERETPSYMIDTLVSFRKDYPHASLNLILGTDAFVQLPQWHQWENLISVANLIVMHRYDTQPYDYPEAIQNVLKHHETQDAKQLLTHPSGLIYCLNAGEYDISSSKIRSDLKQDKMTEDLPPLVFDYIKKHQLYQ